MYFPIIAFAPDADDTQAGVLPDVNDMIPTMRGYAGAPSAIGKGLAALAAECRGAAAVTPLDGTPVLFAGSQTKLYKAGSSSWTDVTRASDYTGSTVSRWVFTQIGNVTIAVNKTDTSQFYTHGSSTDFADMTEMPKALVAEAVGNFLLVGNYNGGTDYVDGWGCSSITDYSDWTASTDTQCTYGRLYDTPGPITGLKRLQEYAIYYKRRSMYLARYVGLPLVWEFSLVSDNVGAVAQSAIIRVGQRHFFLGDDDFYMYDTASVQSIGQPIREWFNANANKAKITSTEAVHDEERGVIYWFFPLGTSTTLNAWVAYNYRSNKWGKGAMSIEAAVQYVAAGMSYDDLDSLYGTYDGFPSASYDELSPAGLSRMPAIFDTAHTLKTLTGASVTSDLTSNDFGIDGAISFMSRLRPRYMSSPTSATMTNYHRDSPGDALTTDQTVMQVSGKFDCLRSARWHRVKIEFAGDVEISGADVETKPESLE